MGLFSESLEKQEIQVGTLVRKAVSLRTADLNKRTVMNVIDLLAISLVDSVWIQGAEDVEVEKIMSKTFDYGFTQAFAFGVKVKKTVAKRCVIRSIAYIEREHKKAKQSITDLESRLQGYADTLVEYRNSLSALSRGEAKFVQCGFCKGLGKKPEIQDDVKVYLTCMECGGVGSFVQIIQKKEVKDGRA